MMARKEVIWGAPFISDKTLSSMIYDPRDVPVARCVIDMFALWVIPGMMSFLFHVPTAIYAGFLLARVGYLLRYMGTIHVTTHRWLFKNRWLRNYEPITSCFFGIPSGVYYAHHMKMHHGGNNVYYDDDLSSTMLCQRDSIKGLLKYLWFVWFGQLPFLPVYLWKHSTMRDFLYFVFCLSGYAGCMKALWGFNAHATLWVFLMPLAVFPFLIFTGNYAQHLLLNPELYDHGLGNTINCLGEINSYSFNDSYHVNHHMNPGLHWSLHPEFYEQQLETFAEHDTLVFKDVGGHVEVLYYILTGNFKFLYDHWVVMGTPRTYEEFVTMIRKRCQPIVTHKEK